MIPTVRTALRIPTAQDGLESHETLIFTRFCNDR
jgi:hypothetical protein